MARRSRRSREVSGGDSVAAQLPLPCDQDSTVAADSTDRVHTRVRVVTDLLPAALHDTTQYANNRVQYVNNRAEADHGRLKARLRPMRGLKRARTTSVVIRGHAFIQNLRRRHYELGVDAAPDSRLPRHSMSLRWCSEGPISPRPASPRLSINQRNSAVRSTFQARFPRY